MNIKKTIKILFTWRIILFLIAALGISLLPFKDSFPYRESLLEPFGHQLFYSWANFDGVHYLGIAQRGYFADFTQAFFPLYPLTIRFLDMIIHNTLLSGLIISHVSLILAIFTLYKLVKLDFSHKVAITTLILLLFFPTSYYLASVYTESFFLLLVLGSFYFMRTKRPKLAILFAALASATRPIGILLLPSLIIEKYLQTKPKNRTNLFIYVPYILAASGLLAYMLYLHQNFSDALYFLHAQPAFGAERSADKIILIYQVIYRYLRMSVTVKPLSLLFYTVMQEFIFSIIFLFLSLIALKKIRISYAAFGIFATLTPTITGTFSSMPRYILVAFPVFIYLATIKNKRLRTVWLILSAILLTINTILFTRGYWVA